MNIAIYNLDAAVTNESLTALFASFGTVETAEISVDVFTGVSRGFGHVVMSDDAQAAEAVKSLHGTNWQGHVLAVEQAPERKEQKGSYKVGTGTVWTQRPARRR